jgi:hypothetical protein
MRNCCAGTRSGKASCQFAYRSRDAVEAEMRTHHEDTANEIHGAFRWRTFAPNDLSITDGTLEECAEAMGTTEEDIARAIEEFGRCDVELMVAWVPNDENGLEWPTAESP